MISEKLDDVMREVLQETGKAGKLIGSLDDLTKAKRRVVRDLLAQGKKVELIPRSNVQGVNTPDFKINGVIAELKTLENPNLNTPLKKIRKAFDKQGAELVIYDVRDAGLSVEQVEIIYSRLNGLYKGKVPGQIEFWTNNGIINK